MTAERVAMDLAAAQRLVDRYRDAARELGRASTDVADRVEQAAEVLDLPPTMARLRLESLDFDCCHFSGLPLLSPSH